MPLISEIKARPKALVKRLHEEIKKHLKAMKLHTQSTIWNVSRIGKNEWVVDKTTDWWIQTTNDLETTTKFLNHEIDNFDVEWF